VTATSTAATPAPAGPEAVGLPPPEEQAAEEQRWLAWFGTPVVIAAVFMAIAFGTGQAWVLTFTVVVLIGDILVLIMLVLTSDTNRIPARARSAPPATAAVAVSAPARSVAEPEAVGVPPPEVQAAEEQRWLAWFGTPVVIAAVFMAIAFGTGQAWVLTFTVVVLIGDILVLIMLVLTTDTNRVTGDAAAAHERGGAVTSA
jgi:hypothetical protein